MTATQAARHRTSAPGRALRRRRESTAALLDGHGTTLYGLASVLTRSSARAEQLVIRAIAEQKTGQPRLTDEQAKRSLCATIYTVWAEQELPRSPFVSRSDPTTVRLALQELPDDQLAALALCRFGEHTYREAALVLNRPAPEVAAMLRDALRALTLAVA